jgi:hypothetical protein
VSFHLRLLDNRSYAEVCGELDRASSGDAGALRSLVARCSPLLHGERFRHWHSAYGWLLEDWSGRLERAVAASLDEKVADVTEIAVALCCMPEFQYSVHAAPARSPNLVVLGDYDAGLYGALADADPWFDKLFAQRFPRESARYHVDDAMIVLEKDDVRRLGEAASRIEPPPAGASGPGAALARLRSLVQRASAEPDLTVAVSELV